jgi:hypothetical protein
MGSGSNTVTTNQTQQYTPNQPIKGMGETAGSMATTAAQAPFQMPVAPVAPFSPFQSLGFGETLGMQGMAQPYFNTAGNYLAGSAAPITGQEVANYYNPMASNVFGQMQNIFGQQMRETTGNATQQAGGVGADRIGVAQANLANQQGLAAGQTAAGLYDKALSAAEQQKQMEAGAGFGFGQFGPAAQAAQQNAINQLLGVGGQQQQLSQAELNAIYQNQLAQIAYPFQTAQYLAGITGGLAPAMGGTTQGQATTQYPQPSPFAQILGGATAGAGILGSLGQSGMFGGTSGGFGGQWSSPSTPFYGSGYSAPGTTYIGGNAYPMFQHGGQVRRDDGGAVDDEYGRLADREKFQEFGQTIGAAAHGNPLAAEVEHAVGLQGGGTPPMPMLPQQAMAHASPFAQGMPFDNHIHMGRGHMGMQQPPPQLPQSPQPMQTPTMAQLPPNPFGNPALMQQGFQMAQGASPQPTGGTPFMATFADGGDVWPATFRERFATNPQGQFAVMRPSANVEDSRNRSFISKVLGQGAINFGQNVKGVGSAIKDTLSFSPLFPSQPPPTNDPLASQLGINSVHYQDGGDVDVAPTFPGSSPPKIGGPSPIPSIRLQPGAGKSGPYGQFMPIQTPSMQGQGQGGSGTGQAISAAMQMLPMLAMMKQGGSIGYEDGGDADYIPPTGPPVPMFKPLPPTVSMAEAPPGSVPEMGLGEAAPKDQSRPPLEADVPLPQPRPPTAGNPFAPKPVQTTTIPAGQVSMDLIPGDQTAAAIAGAEGDASGSIGETPGERDIDRAHVGMASAPGARPPRVGGPSPFGTYDHPSGPIPYPAHRQMDWGQRLATSPWMALVKAGATMMASPGNIGTVIGKGLGAGAAELEGQRKSLDSEESINQKAASLEERAAYHLREIQRKQEHGEAMVDLRRQQAEANIAKQQAGLAGRPPSLQDISKEVYNDPVWSARSATDPNAVSAEIQRRYQERLQMYRQETQPGAGQGPTGIGTEKTFNQGKFKKVKPGPDNDPATWEKVPTS